MPVEVRPLGVKCNIACHYCYQESVRTAGGNSKEYDLEAIKATIVAKGGPFTLFGGEPLLMPKPDMEDLLAWGFSQFGSSSIQTNAVLLDDEHIEMFLRYKVHIGVSLDGPDVCNTPRWAGSEIRTEAATQKAERALNRLLEAGIRPSIITTLHKFNASLDALPRLIEWFRHLDGLGVRSARIHLLESETENVRSSLALSTEEYIQAMLALSTLERNELRNLRFDLFREIDALLLAKDKGVSCVWRACDPYTTEAVQGIEGHGESSNCGRTNKSGVDFVKANTPSFERYLALYYTPYENGGCKGCRFFLMCKGHCPGTSIDGDWRNRTEHCSTWFQLFKHAEARLKEKGYLPISLDPNREVLEKAMLDQWAAAKNPPLWWVLDRLRAKAKLKWTQR
jgi:uncharacterized protein